MKANIGILIRDRIEQSCIKNPQFPNQAIDTGDGSYSVLQWLDPIRTGGTLKGGETLTENGAFSLRVVTPVGFGEVPAEKEADVIADLFAETTVLEDDAVKITILSPPDIRGGFRASDDWCVPVVVAYKAQAKR